MQEKISSSPAPQSATHGVKVILSLFMLITVFLAVSIYFEGRLLDGVRAYVRGEGLWAKSQKDAVLFLERYSYSKQEDDYRHFLEALVVISGDQNARLDLLEIPPNISDANIRFRLGQNDSEDIDALVWFFTNFHTVSFFQEAISIWEEADAKIAEMQAIAVSLHANLNNGSADAEQVKYTRARLKSLNAELLRLENRFSQVLSNAARWTKNVVWAVSLALLLLFLTVGLTVTFRIIRQIRVAEADLMTSRSRFSSLKNSNTIGIASWRMNGEVFEANDVLLEMLGFSRLDLEEKRINWQNLTPPECRERDKQAIQELQDYGRCEPYEKSFLNRQGVSIPVYLGASLIQGDETQGIAFVMDLRQRKQAEDELKIAGMIYQSSSEGMLVTDGENKILAINPAFTAMTGYSAAEVIGRTPELLSAGVNNQEVRKTIWAALDQSGYWQGEIWHRRKNGEIYAEWLTINTIFNQDGSVHKRVALLSDITERKRKEEVIQFQADHDELTGLPNRRLINDRIEQEISKYQRSGSGFALIFIDLDGFKAVNDIYGHVIGDQLLKAAAIRMKDCARDSDSVGRLGGDEFVIILHNIEDPDDCYRITQNLLLSLASHFVLKDIQVTISASIGIALFPEHGLSATELLTNADVAMYQAKTGGKNRFKLFSLT